VLWSGVVLFCLLESGNTDAWGLTPEIKLRLKVVMGAKLLHCQTSQTFEVTQVTSKSVKMTLFLRYEDTAT
jgi:hypothetical protein